MLIFTDAKVFQALLDAYRNSQGAEYIEKEIQKGNGVLSSRSIREYFNKGLGKGDAYQQGRPRMRSDNLDYLCQVLLKISYKEAESFYSVALSDRTVLQKYREHLERKCGNICVLDMNQNIELAKIYTEARFLESPRSRAERETAATFHEMDAAFSRGYQPPDPYRLAEDGEQVFQDADRVVAENSKLMILGLPGAGKSTFLKHLALRYLDASLGEQDILPLYIELRAISRRNYTSLMDAIRQEFVDYMPVLESKIEMLLEKGQLLILLDALDEVSAQTFDFVVHGIDEITTKYPDNRFVITCRTKSFTEYKFSSFVDVELAGFSRKEISSMAHRWFEARQIELSDGELLTGSRFMEDLDDKPSLAELARNPLILTYLLYNYEQNMASMPRRKITVFNQVVEIFRHRWDNTRLIKRRDLQEDVTEISYLDEELLVRLLSHIAYEGFIGAPRKVAWSRFEIEDLIRDFLKRVVDEKINPDKILLAIEANNGFIFEDSTDIFVFRSLALQEYFAALHIVEQRSDILLGKVIENHLYDRYWSEVFPLITDRLNNSDDFLRAVDTQIKSDAANSSVMVKYLNWLNEMTSALLEEDASSSWAALIALLDLDTALYTRRLTKKDDNVNRIPFLDLELGIQQFNVVRQKTTDKTPKLIIALRLVIIDALANEEMAKLSVENSSDVKDLLPLQEIPKYVKEILVISERTSLAQQLKRVTDKASETQSSEISSALKKLQENVPIGSTSLETWKSWIADLNDFMKEKFNIGYKDPFSANAYQSLEDHVYAYGELLRCINESTYTSSISLRKELVESILAPPYR
ncbi:MAG: NACHT domain-containing protein [Leptolyngbyaceae cyanobacterium]